MASTGEADLMPLGSRRLDATNAMVRRTLDMPKLPFEDEVRPKFLRENALKLPGLVE